MFNVKKESEMSITSHLIFIRVVYYQNLVMHIALQTVHLYGAVLSFSLVNPYKPDVFFMGHGQNAAFHLGLFCLLTLISVKKNEIKRKK